MLLVFVACKDPEQSIDASTVNCDSLEGYIKKMEEQSQKKYATVQEKKSADSLNQVILVNIVNVCGFPPKEKIGMNGFNILLNTVQNSGFQMRQQYYPLLQQLALQGDIPLSEIAIMEDRLLVDQNLKQKYGTQLDWNPETQSFDLKPLENPDSLDIWRERRGLPDFEKYKATLEQYYLNKQAGK